MYYGSEKDLKDAPEFLKHSNVFIWKVAPSVDQYITQLVEEEKDTVLQVKSRVPKDHWKDERKDE